MSAKVSWECSVPEQFCEGSPRATFRGPIKNYTYKFHGTPESARRCQDHYSKAFPGKHLLKCGTNKQGAEA